jgi:hypothetical protein
MKDLREGKMRKGAIETAIAIRSGRCLRGVELDGA